MKSTLVLKEMVRKSGKTAIQISREIGRKDNYVSSLIHSGSVPSVETFASIAQACGAQLCVVYPDRMVQMDGWDAIVSEQIVVSDGGNGDSGE